MFLPLIRNRIYQSEKVTGHWSRNQLYHESDPAVPQWEKKRCFPRSKTLKHVSTKTHSLTSSRVFCLFQLMENTCCDFSVWNEARCVTGFSAQGPFCITNKLLHLIFQILNFSYTLKSLHKVYDTHFISTVSLNVCSDFYFYFEGCVSVVLTTTL